jgi:thiamine-monophosphate kinase
VTTELAFIEALRGLASHPGARGLDDDCAVIAFGDEVLVLTHDMMVEGVHYLPDQDPADVAWKLVATNMSDLAAKGAEPVGVLLGYMLGPDDARFLDGLAEALAHFGGALLGGDTVAGPSSRALGLTAIGRATHRPVPSRGGARPDDVLYVTGPLGAAMLGLEALQAGQGDSLAYRRPQALLSAGRALAPHVTAMMDVSDGLLLDAARLAQASGVTLTVDTAAVPIATPEDRRDEALRWGDDYQLLFTAPPGAMLPVAAYPVGSAIAAQSTPLLIDGRPTAKGERLGFEHRPM